MPEIVHESIGERERRLTVEKEVKQEKVAEIIDRFMVTPYKGKRLDQLTVWALWTIAASSLFLFCTVTAVRLALR